MNNNNSNDNNYETILFEREKIIRFLKLPEDIDSLEFNSQMYIIYKKGKAFLRYVEDTNLKIGDSTLIPQIDFNKNISIENALTIYKNTYTFAQNTCRYLDVDLYGAAINLLVEVFNRIVTLIEENDSISIDDIEVTLINNVRLEDTNFYITNKDLFIDGNSLDDKKILENVFNKRNEIYDIYKKQDKEYSILSDLEGFDIININYGIVNLIVKKDETNREQFDKIVNEINLTI